MQVYTLFLQATADIPSSGPNSWIIALIGALSLIFGGGHVFKVLEKKYDTDNLKEQIENLKVSNKELESDISRMELEHKNTLIQFRGEIKELTTELNEMTFKFEQLVDRINIFHQVKTENASLEILLNKSDKDGK